MDATGWNGLLGAQAELETLKEGQRKLKCPYVRIQHTKYEYQKTLEISDFQLGRKRRSLKYQTRRVAFAFEGQKIWRTEICKTTTLQNKNF